MLSSLAASAATSYPVTRLILDGNASGGGTNSFTNLNSVIAINNVTAEKSFTLNGGTITNWSFGTEATNYADSLAQTMTSYVNATALTLTNYVIALGTNTTNWVSITFAPSNWVDSTFFKAAAWTGWSNANQLIITDSVTNLVQGSGITLGRTGHVYTITAAATGGMDEASTNWVWLNFAPSNWVNSTFFKVSDWQGWSNANQGVINFAPTNYYAGSNVLISVTGRVWYFSSTASGSTVDTSIFANITSTVMKSGSNVWAQSIYTADLPAQQYNLRFTGAAGFNYFPSGIWQTDGASEGIVWTFPAMTESPDYSVLALGDGIGFEKYGTRWGISDTGGAGNYYIEVTDGWAKFPNGVELPGSAIDAAKPNILTNGASGVTLDFSSLKLNGTNVSAGADVLLEFVTVTSPVAAIHVTNIPTIYVGLRIEGDMVGDSASDDYWGLFYNYDTGVNYPAIIGGPIGAGTSGAYAATNYTYACAGIIAKTNRLSGSTFSVIVRNYADDTRKKTLGQGAGIDIGSMGTYSRNYVLFTLWMTNAIVDIGLTSINGSNFVAGTKVWIYGITQ